jgi:hypothetical protein
MKLAHLAMTAIAVGVLLVLVSFAWPSLVPRESVWSDEQAEQWRQEGGEVHRLAHERAHADAHPGEAEAMSADLEAAKSRYQRWDVELKEAQAVRQRHAAILKWIGVGCMVAGVGVLLVARGRPE